MPGSARLKRPVSNSPPPLPPRHPCPPDTGCPADPEQFAVSALQLGAAHLQLRL